MQEGRRQAGAVGIVAVAVAVVAAAAAAVAVAGAAGEDAGDARGLDGIGEEEDCEDLFQETEMRGQPKAVWLLWRAPAPAPAPARPRGNEGEGG